MKFDPSKPHGVIINCKQHGRKFEQDGRYFGASGDEIVDHSKVRANTGDNEAQSLIAKAKDEAQAIVEAAKAEAARIAAEATKTQTTAVPVADTKADAKPKKADQLEATLKG